MLEIDHTLLSAETLDNLIIDIITRESTDYGVTEKDIAQKKSQILLKLEREEASIVYCPLEGFCNILSADDIQTKKIQQLSLSLDD